VVAYPGRQGRLRLLEDAPDAVVREAAGLDQVRRGGGGHGWHRADRLLQPHQHRHRVRLRVVAEPAREEHDQVVGTDAEPFAAGPPQPQGLGASGRRESRRVHAQRDHRQPRAGERPRPAAHQPVAEVVLVLVEHALDDEPRGR
jgi:hypothetical protein